MRPTDHGVEWVYPYKKQKGLTITKVQIILKNQLILNGGPLETRSEERRVGKECM